jgi:Fe-S-cluster containining protein
MYESLQNLRQAAQSTESKRRCLQEVPEGMAVNCLACDGRCCKYIDVVQPGLTEDDKLYLKLHGAQFLPGDIVRLPVRCEALDNEGRCMVYLVRPELCKRYRCEGDPVYKGGPP